MTKPVITNAADEKQAQEAKGKLKRKRMAELNDVRDVLAIPAGRRVLLRLIAEFRVSQSVMDPNPGIQSWNSGRQDAAQFILGEIVVADFKVGAEMLAQAYEMELGGKQV